MHANPECLTNLALERGHRSRCETMRSRLFAELAAQHDPRMEGPGAECDRYPNAATAHDFYTRRILKSEKVPAYWVEEMDFESPDFDPERPLKPRSP